MVMKQMINTLTNFLSSKINLTIMQCILYGVLGYLLKGNYDWTQFCIVFVILLGIQFITHIKGVSQGMVMHQLWMDDHPMIRDHEEFMKYMEQLKEDNKNDEEPN